MDESQNLLRFQEHNLVLASWASLLVTSLGAGLTGLGINLLVKHGLVANISTHGILVSGLKGKEGSGNSICISISKNIKTDVVQ